MAHWVVDMYSKHFSHRLKGKAGTKRPIPMTRVMLLLARFYRLMCGHPPAGVYLKRFGYRDEHNCWWCGSTLSETWKHLFRHCNQWRDLQKELWKAVGEATGWKAGRCRLVQISELLSLDQCDQAVLDFLAAIEIGKSPPRQVEE
jgi:hypothetical protein